METQSYMVAGFVLFALIMVFPLAMQGWIRLKTRGRHLAVIIEAGKPLVFRMLRVDGDKIHDGNDDFLIKDSQTKITDYPIIFPRLLSAFQVPVPASLYKRGTGNPINWEDPSIRTISSKELKAILDPEWMRALVKGVVAESGVAKHSSSERILTFLTLGASAICLVLLFLVMTKISGLEQAVKLIHP